VARPSCGGRRSGGRAGRSPARRAGEILFVPILLATLTAIGGLLPLALERSALQTPPAWVILGGLVSSTLLTRVVTPVLYALLPPEIARRAEIALEATAPAGAGSTDGVPVGAA